MATDGVSWRLEKSKCHSYLQNAQEGKSWELQALQSHLRPQEGVDKILLQVFPNTKDKNEAEEQYALIYEGEIVLKKPG